MKPVIIEISSKQFSKSTYQMYHGQEAQFINTAGEELLVDAFLKTENKTKEIFGISQIDLKTANGTANPYKKNVDDHSAYGTYSLVARGKTIGGEVSAHLEIISGPMDAKDAAVG